MLSRLLGRLQHAAACGMATPYGRCQRPVADGASCGADHGAVVVQHDGPDWLPSRPAAPVAAGPLVAQFGAESAAVLCGAGVPATVAVAYPRRFVAADIAALHLAGVSPDLSRAYHRDFSASEIVDLWQSGVGPEYAGAYDRRWSGHDIAVLHRGGVNDFESKEWPLSYRAVQVVRDVQAGALSDNGRVFWG